MNPQDFEIELNRLFREGRIYVNVNPNDNFDYQAPIYHQFPNAEVDSADESNQDQTQIIIINPVIGMSSKPSTLETE